MAQPRHQHNAKICFFQYQSSPHFLSKKKKKKKNHALKGQSGTDKWEGHCFLALLYWAQKLFSFQINY